MKTTLLFILAIVIGISVSAQKIAMVPYELAKKEAVKVAVVPDPMTNPSSIVSTTHSTDAAPGVNETQVGMSLYDLQTNGSIQNRIYAYPDGTVGAVWTTGWIPPATAFSDRGTGYNYFDGTTWGEIPTTRIASETVKNGWPSYCPLGAGEMVISHTSGTAGLLFTRREVKGTGTWTTSYIPSTPNFLWPRVITNSNTIHVLTLTAPIANGGALYQGLDGALLYFKSIDNGVTWTAPIILPGLDAATIGLGINFAGLSGDGYGWAASRGDSIGFVVTDDWGGLKVYKSFDNGETWAHTTVFSFPSPAVSNIAYPTCDGAVSAAMDKNGIMHIAFGRMVVIDEDVAATGSSYRPYTDGLIYWNENMPALDTTIISSITLDSLYNHGNLAASMQDYDANGTIDFPDVATGAWPFGNYQNSLSSFSQIAIDNNDNIFISFSECREDLINTSANPNTQLYRHLFLTSKEASQTEFITARDLTDDIEHSYDECVFASMSYSVNDKLHFIYQVDAEPGLSVRGDEDPTFSESYQNYLTFPTFVSVKPVDIAKDVMVSPNPAHDYANVLVLLQDVQKVELNVYDAMGKLVYNNNVGVQAIGYHNYNVNTSNLTSGIYLFTVKIGNSQTSKKVVVN